MDSTDEMAIDVHNLGANTSRVTGHLVAFALWTAVLLIGVAGFVWLSVAEQLFAAFLFGSVVVLTVVFFVHRTLDILPRGVAVRDDNGNETGVAVVVGLQDRPARTLIFSWLAMFIGFSLLVAAFVSGPVILIVTLTTAFEPEGGLAVPLGASLAMFGFGIPVLKFGLAGLRKPTEPEVRGIAAILGVACWLGCCQVVFYSFEAGWIEASPFRDDLGRFLALVLGVAAYGFGVKLLMRREGIERRRRARLLGRVAVWLLAWGTAKFVWDVLLYVPMPWPVLGPVLVMAVGIGVFVFAVRNYGADQRFLRNRRMHEVLLFAAALGVWMSAYWFIDVIVHYGLNDRSLRLMAWQSRSIVSSVLAGYTYYLGLKWLKQS